MNNIQASIPRTTTVPTLERITALVSDDMLRVNQVILDSISQDVKLIADIGQHIIAAGGKRLRPAITIASAKLCGYDGNKHIKLAASVELIHTATLLHDDVVDESSLRRGDQTANAIWDNQASVLVGDFLISRAFQLMVAEKSLEVLRILSDASATISQGEVKQLMTSGEPNTSFEAYLDVITGKTAALFAAAAEIGAVLGDKSDEERKKMRQFGDYLGIAFQLVDDALDYAASQEALGKTVGDDFREGKVTQPVILAFQEGTAEEQAFWNRTIHDNEQTDTDLPHAMTLIAKYDTITRTINTARDYCNKAEACLNSFDDGEAKEALIETLDFCVNREF